MGSQVCSTDTATQVHKEEEIKITIYEYQFPQLSYIVPVLFSLQNCYGAQRSCYLWELSDDYKELYKYKVLSHTI